MKNCPMSFESLPSVPYTDLIVVADLFTIPPTIPDKVLLLLSKWSRNAWTIDWTIVELTTLLVSTTKVISREPFLDS